LYFLRLSTCAPTFPSLFVVAPFLHLLRLVACGAVSFFVKGPGEVAADAVFGVKAGILLCTNWSLLLIAAQRFTDSHQAKKA